MYAETSLVVTSTIYNLGNDPELSLKCRCLNQDARLPYLAEGLFLGLIISPEFLNEVKTICLHFDRVCFQYRPSHLHRFLLRPSKDHFFLPVWGGSCLPNVNSTYKSLVGLK